MLDLLRKEHHAEPLTPPERAALKFIWSALLSSIFIGVEAALTSLQSLNGVPVDWLNVLRDAIILALFTFGHTILGYLKASKDANITLLGTVADSEITHIQEQYYQQKAKGISS